MDELARMIDRIQVRATLPNVPVVATLSERTCVSLAFAPGVYRRYETRELERHLSGLARVLWSKRMKIYYQVVSEANGRNSIGERGPVGRRDHEYLSERSELVAKGVSDDNRVVVSVKGMTDWTFALSDDALFALSESQFGDMLGSACRRLIEDQYQQVSQLKNRVYDESSDF